jgi:hypothetical protein
MDLVSGRQRAEHVLDIVDREDVDARGACDVQFVGGAGAEIEGGAGDAPATTAAAASSSTDGIQDSLQRYSATVTAPERGD